MELKTLGFMLILGSMAAIVFAESDVFKNPTPEDPWYNLPLPKQRPGYYKFVAMCAEKTTRACGVQVFNAIFARELVNDLDCCKNIVEAKYICNRSLATILQAFDKFNKDKHLIYEQSNAIFENCQDLMDDQDE